MLPGGAAVVHTRKPIRTGKTTARHCLVLRVESRHITDVTLDDLIYHRWATSSGVDVSHLHRVFFSVAVITQDSFAVLTVVVGGEVRWGVVAPPSDLEGQDYVGCSRAFIYSTLPSTGLSGYPGRITNRGQRRCHSKELPFPSLYKDLHDEQHYCCLLSAPMISLL